MKRYSTTNQPTAFAPFADRISEVHDWRDPSDKEHYGEPLFVFLKPGWHPNDDLVHAVSGFTVAEVVGDLKNCSYGEACDDCRAELIYELAPADPSGELGLLDDLEMGEEVPA